MREKPVRQKVFLCKLLILIYFFVVAILPLSNVYFHEILFSHFVKNSDQARTSSSTSVKCKLSINIFRTNLVAKLNHLKYQDSMEALLLFPHQTTTHIYSQSNTNMEKMFRGFPYLYSGLSPPFV